MDEQLRKLVASVRAYHGGQFAKKYDELVVAFTADEAQALL